MNGFSRLKSLIIVQDIFWGSGCVAHLVEPVASAPEVHSSNPVIGKNLFICLLSTVYWKDENKEKEPFF